MPSKDRCEKCDRLPHTVIGIDVPGRLSTKGGKGAYGGWATVSVTTGEILRHGTWVFGPEMSERAVYTEMARRLDFERGLYNHNVVLAIEAPFLHVIAQHVGSLKMYCALREITWWMVSSPQARKLVLGSGRTGKGLAKQNKKEVLVAMQDKIVASITLTQHEADAILYALAYRRWIETGGK
jgi:hypothetical protein